MESQTEALILGSGIAACTAALALTKDGVKVTLVAPDWNSPSAEIHSSGIFYRGEGDSKEIQCEDLKRLGGDLSCPRALEHLINEGTTSVDKWLIHELQLAFERDEDGAWSYTMEEGHSIPRTIRLGHNTSEQILTALKHKLESSPNVEILTHTLPVQLITLAEHSTHPADLYKKPACLGAYLLNEQTGSIYPLLAKETILASGGIHELFVPQDNTKVDSQSIALAAKAGARLIQLHTIQQQRGNTPRYFINGGIAVDKVGQTSVMRLRAIGESACTGVHGTGCHPSVQLLESIVWANATAQDLMKQLHKFAYYFPPLKAFEQGQHEFPSELLASEWNTLRTVMRHYMVPKSSKEALRRARSILEQQAIDLEPLYEKARLSPQLIGLRHATEMGRLIAKALVENY